jgi:hypothetical protein
VRAGAGEIADARDRAWRIVEISTPHGGEKNSWKQRVDYIKFGTKQHNKHTNLIDGVVNFNEDFY